MAFKMKGFSPFTKKEETKSRVADELAKMATVAATARGPKYKSALKQTDVKLSEESKSSATVGGKVYPNIRYLGEPEHADLLNSLPGNLFVGGKNTGDAGDVIANAYDNYIGEISKSPEPGTTTTKDVDASGAGTTTTRVVK